MTRFKPKWLLTTTFLILLLPNIILSIVEPMCFTAKLCNVFLPCGVYLLLLSISRNPAKSVWILFPLIFLSAFQLVLLYLYGHSIIAVDMFLNLVTTNPEEVGELLGSMLPAVIGVVVVFLPLLVIAAVNSFKKDYIIGNEERRVLRGYGYIAIFAGSIALLSSYKSQDFTGKYSVLDDLYPVNVFYNIDLAADRQRKTAEYGRTSQDFSFGAKSSHPADSLGEIYVLVIGETARAENFGIFGYNRNTTPRLAKEKGLIKFPEAYTQSNTTHKSVPMLLSAANADDYDRIYKEKSLITAFKEAGFKTSFISNQRPNHSFIDIFGEEADKCIFLKNDLPADSNVYDLALLDNMKEALASDTGRQLIVLHTYGSHFRYRERYPRDLAIFTPDEADEVEAGNRDNLINAYDNTIAYTDLLLGSVIDGLKNTGRPAAMIYTSDHGENIFDDERGLFLHASPRPSKHELHVPMLVWLSDEYTSRFPDTKTNLDNNSGKRLLTSASVFHTMLDVAGIDTRVKTDSLSAASGKYKEIDYNYLSDRNIPVAVEEIMLPEVNGRR